MVIGYLASFIGNLLFLVPVHYENFMLLKRKLNETLRVVNWLIEQVKPKKSQLQNVLRIMKEILSHFFERTKQIKI